MKKNETKNAALIILAGLLMLTLILSLLPWDMINYSDFVICKKSPFLYDGRKASCIINYP